jgi:hypothetical protein
MASQSEEALRLYRYYKINNNKPGERDPASSDAQWNMVSLEMKKMLDKEG